MLSDAKTPCDSQLDESTDSSACEQSAKKWVLIASILGSGMAFLNGSVVNVALPAIQTAFDGGVGDVQWILNGYAVLLAALILVGGSLGDIYGRRKIFGIGIFIFLIASLWSGLSPTVLQLILARALQGIGGALVIPNSLSLISSAYSRNERGKAIGTWSAFSAITTAIGPVLGGWLVDSFSWRPVFFISVPVAIAALIIVTLKVPEFTDEEETKSLDLKGSLLVTLGLSSLSLGLIRASESSFSDILVISSLLFGLVLMILFILQEKNSDHPMMPLDVFKSKTFSGVNLATLFIYFALSGVFFFLPFNLIQVQEYSATEAGAAFLPFTLIMGFLSRWSGGLVDRFGEKLPLIIGPVLTAIGFFLLGFLGHESNYWTSFLPGILIIGVGMAVTVSPLTTAVMNSVNDNQTGVASGINNSVSRLAGMLAVAVLGVVAVQLFSGELSQGLNSIELKADLAESLENQSSKLAGISLGDSIPDQQQSAIKNIINTSYLFTFRWMMLGSGIITLIGALVSAITLKSNR